MRNFFEGTFEIMMKITDLIMRFAPIGVFALVANIVATSGVEVFIPLAKFFFIVIAALAIHMFIVMPVLLKIIGRVKPTKHFAATEFARIPKHRSRLVVTERGNVRPDGNVSARPDG